MIIIFVEFIDQLIDYPIYRASLKLRHKIQQSDQWYLPYFILAPRSTKTRRPGPSCSKLTMSLANNSLKFTSSDMQICWNFLLKKCE